VSATETQPRSTIAADATPVPDSRVVPARARRRVAWLRAWPIVLAALLLALAALFADMIIDGVGAPAPALGGGQAEPPPVAATPAIMPALKPLASYAETVARPLFSPIRRAPAPATAAAALGEVSGFVITGVIVNERERHAFIQRGRPGATLRVVEGQQIDGWTVRSIMRDRILLQHGATEHELRLKAGP
jgi:hypothetical protein